MNRPEEQPTAHQIIETQQIPREMDQERWRTQPTSEETNKQEERKTTTLRNTTTSFCQQ